MTAPEDFNLDAFLPYRLAVLAAQVSRGFSGRYRERFGLSISEWRVMAHLSQADSVSVRDIHDQANLEKSKASRAAARLEAAGLVAKREGESDRRLVAISLTDKGRELMADLIPVALGYEAELLSSLSAEDKAALDRIVNTLLRSGD